MKLFYVSMPSRHGKQQQKRRYNFSLLQLDWESQRKMSILARKASHHHHHTTTTATTTTTNNNNNNNSNRHLVVLMAVKFCHLFLFPLSQLLNKIRTCRKVNGACNGSGKAEFHREWSHRFVAGDVFFFFWCVFLLMLHLLKKILYYSETAC